MMFNLLKDQLIDEAVLRAEQWRVSYNLQTEEFRSLNANLQTYLGDIKTIDDENRQLQESIEEIRTKYVLTLENHLKVLPNEFCEQGQTLTNAHLERYRLKSRVRRCVTEREEWKRRIQFLTTNDKQQTKYFNQLERQDRLHRQEFQKLNEQYQRLVKTLANEKDLHRQAMTKVDQLQLQLEQSWIDRSKTEFQIQSLKEELQLMQTTKEFLSEERDTILSSRHEANDYFLSQLHESIARIREDFEKLNQTQLQQIEQDYQQMLQTLEENLLANATNQLSNPSEYEPLQHEQQIVEEEWTALNDQNQILTERILTMENSLHGMRQERMQQLIGKDHELEQSKMELQTLNEKLLHLADYDRNLKFELTLYRGVLESEYRRKQVANNPVQLSRPTTLRTNQSNSNSDRRTRLTSVTKSSQSNDPQPTSILSTENRVSSDEDLLSDVKATRNPLNIEKLLSGEGLWQQLMEPFSKVQPSEQTSADASPLGDRKPSRSPSTTANTERTRTLPSTPPIQDGHQSVNSSSQLLLTLLSESQSSPTSPQQYQGTPEAQHAPSQTPQSPSTPSRTSSTSSKMTLEQKRSPTSATSRMVSESQMLASIDPSSESPQEVRPSSRTSSISSKTSPYLEKSPLTVIEHQPSPTADVQRSSRTSSISSKAPSDTHESLTAAHLPLTSEIQASFPDEDQPPSRTSSISSQASLNQQKSLFFTTTDDILQPASPVPEDAQTLSNPSETSTVVANEQPKNSPITIGDYQITASTEHFDEPNQASASSFTENDDNIQYEDSVSYPTDEKGPSEIDRYEHRQSAHSIEQISAADADILSSDKSTGSHSSIGITNADEEPETQVQREEPTDSSPRRPTEENVSSTNQSSPFFPPDASKQSSADTSLTDVEEVEPSASPEYHRTSNDDDDSNLAIIMQDLRDVFQTLVTENEVVEINNELPDRILDHLECRDQFIRTLFNDLIHKYLVQPAVQSARSNTLTWFEFRDILFPLITGRYTERHIRKLFELFDTTQDGYLSLQEIAELLQVLHASDTIDLAQTIIDEFDTDHDGKLNVDELLEAIKCHNDINEHALSEETENKEWFNQSVSDDLTITLEVPIINFPPKINDKLIESMTLLGQIFQRLGANTDTYQLDIRTENFVQRMTEEFLRQNPQISRDDLQSFIQSYFDQKGVDDSSMNWSDFRDLFLPIISPGSYSRPHLQRWFNLFDRNQTGFIKPDQALRIFRLLQLPNLDNILQKFNQIADDISSWTFDDFLYILDEHTSHSLPDTNQISSFDNQWLSKTLF